MNAIERFADLAPEGCIEEMTREQRVSCITVIERQGVDKLVSVFPAGCINPYVGLQFTHIFIGVEPDGYAHS